MARNLLMQFKIKHNQHNKAKILLHKLQVNSLVEVPLILPFNSSRQRQTLELERIKGYKE